MINCLFQPPSAKGKGSLSKPKPNLAKPNVTHISLSLREDVKLRETENAWKPRLEKMDDNDTLNKKVRSVLNKLTPEKFSTLVDQVRKLPIDTLDRLQGVIDLVFEKVICLVHYILQLFEMEVVLIYFFPLIYRRSTSPAFP